MFKRLFIIFALVFTVLATSSCGKESESSKVEIKIIPSSPTVFPGNITIPDGSGGTSTITGPYFRWRARVINHSKKEVVVTGFILTVYDSHGTKVGDVSYDSGEVGDPYFVDLAPDDDATIDINFYVESLPKDAPSFRFRVKVEPIGWFGTPDEPDDRFEKTLYFYTR